MPTNKYYLFTCTAEENLISMLVFEQMLMWMLLKDSSKVVEAMFQNLHECNKQRILFNPTSVWIFIFRISALSQIKTFLTSIMTLCVCQNVIFTTLSI